MKVETGVKVAVKTEVCGSTLSDRDSVADSALLQCVSGWGDTLIFLLFRLLALLQHSSVPLVYYPPPSSLCLPLSVLTASLLPWLLLEQWSCLTPHCYAAPPCFSYLPHTLLCWIITTESERDRDRGHGKQKGRREGDKRAFHLTAAFFFSFPSLACWSAAQGTTARGGKTPSSNLFPSRKRPPSLGQRRREEGRD
ncbi:hypothetical protein NQZ68_015680 [Dissostichus eleginoides]|nr:hypothetical protein NQZ68_015680 [Dissostichus eleginoides]